jgi:hypothetical protein
VRAKERPVDRLPEAARFEVRLAQHDVIEAARNPGRDVPCLQCLHRFVR